MVKLQIVIAIMLCQLAAVADDILLQIQSDDADRIPLHLMQIVIHGKGQVGLSASKIDDDIFPGLIQLWQDILDKLQEPVDLAEFIITAFYDPSVLRLHAKIDQKRYRMSLRDHIPFLAVVLQFFEQFGRKARS